MLRIKINIHAVAYLFHLLQEVVRQYITGCLLAYLNPVNNAMVTMEIGVAQYYQQHE